MGDSSFTFNFNEMIKEIGNRLKKRSYLYFGIKLISFFLLIFSLDFIVGNTLRYFYFKQESGGEYSATYLIKKANQDLLIFGSSRALHHYQSNILEERLGLTSYNAGRNGNPILYHLAIFKSALNRHKPKQIILDVNINEFQKVEDGYDVLATLLPYYKEYPEVRPMVLLRGKFEKLKLCSQIYPFNSLIFTIAAGNTQFNKQRKEVFNGYMPLYNQWNKNLTVEYPQKKYEVDLIKIEAFKNFIAVCKANHIKLTLVFSPYFKKFEETNNSISIAKEIAKENNIHFLDFTNDIRFLKNPFLFADYTHLNNNGAKFFTNILIDYLKHQSTIK